jgi:hypothetical protein
VLPSTIHPGTTARSLPNSGRCRSNTLAANLLEEESSAFGIQYFVGDPKRTSYSYGFGSLDPCQTRQCSWQGGVICFCIIFGAWSAAPAWQTPSLSTPSEEGVILAIKYLQWAEPNIIIRLVFFDAPLQWRGTCRCCFSPCYTCV